MWIILKPAIYKFFPGGLMTLILHSALDCHQSDALSLLLPILSHKVSFFVTDVSHVIWINRFLMERHHPSLSLMVLHVSLCLCSFFFCCFCCWRWSEKASPLISCVMFPRWIFGKRYLGFWKRKKTVCQRHFFPSKDVNVFTTGIFFNDGTEEHYVSYTGMMGEGGVEFAVNFLTMRTIQIWINLFPGLFANIHYVCLCDISFKMSL